MRNLNPRREFSGLGIIKCSLVSFYKMLFILLMRNAELRVIKPDSGHLEGFSGFDPQADAFVDRRINDLLKNV